MNNKIIFSFMQNLKKNKKYNNTFEYVRVYAFLQIFRVLVL